jgi:amino acid transporter
MVFAILAFIGFEAAAPLGEEAKNPRRTIPLAVVGSSLAIGLFYVLCSYAWVFGAGFNNFVDQATGADPWRNLGKVFWGTGWILVFAAIVNSIAANSNAAVNAATRVFYALARNGLAPRPLARTHPRFKTPHIAIIWMTAFALVSALLLGWKWGPLIGFFFIATLAVIVVVIVYILICFGCIWHYWTKRRSEFNALLHFVLPMAGAILFFFPLYFQYYKAPPTYPIKYANWAALVWIGAGIVLTLVLSKTRPDRLRDMERVYVEDETLTTPVGPAGPAVPPA